MAREVDKRKTRKALKRLKRASERAAEAEQAGGKGLTDWEKQFVDGVTTRLETYGSAFRDPSKGHLEEALSQRQTAITRVIERKAKAKLNTKTDAHEDKAGSGRTDKPGKASRQPGSTFKRKAPASRGRSRDINEDAPGIAAVPALEPAAPPVRPPKPAGRPRLTVISGGRKD
jgi:hypothetical protein